MALIQKTEKTADADTRLQAYSRDQQPATIAMAVNYHVTDASAVYAQFGSLTNMKSRIIDSRAYKQLKNVFGPDPVHFFSEPGVDRGQTIDSFSRDVQAFRNRILDR